MIKSEDAVTYCGRRRSKAAVESHINKQKERKYPCLQGSWVIGRVHRTATEMNYPARYLKAGMGTTSIRIGSCAFVTYIPENGYKFKTKYQADSFVASLKAKGYVLEGYVLFLAQLSPEGVDTGVKVVYHGTKFIPLAEYLELIK